MTYPSLKITYQDADCPVRVTYQPEDYNGHESYPVSGGAPDLPTALRNLADVLEKNHMSGLLAMQTRADDV